MALEPGRYIAIPMEWSVQETGPNHLATFVCRFMMMQVATSDGWTDAQPDEITGYFYLVKKSGAVNEFTIGQLKDALGWDGSSVASLHDGNWGETEVQLTLNRETYDGKERLKVQWINPRDWAGSNITRDPQVVQSLEAKYGTQLRALNPPKAPAKPNGKPTTPTAAEQRDTAKRAAWEQFKLTHEGTPEEVAEGWKSAFRKYFGDQRPEQIGTAQWKQFAADEFIKIEAPFGDEEEFKPEDIPF